LRNVRIAKCMQQSRFESLFFRGFAAAGPLDPEVKRTNRPGVLWRIKT